ncbi:hypothetical protein GcC1_194032 [Golovinomyces cichoracearum]|uniref:Uncharacterized protein n=1 Tax=Golovinomyces cichoracearum TaxID=62708 RepID=A0A420HH35_9PEZI|nr:hypothetical protein GcC1_194032 [Golovinomyces cichoracearum]
MLLISDIHPHWHFNRGSVPIPIAQRQLLDPLPVLRGKGRPKGSRNRGKNQGQSSTRRDPSLFEHVESQSIVQSTVPSFPQSFPQSTVPSFPQSTVQSLPQPVPRLQSMTSTTQLAISRGAGSIEDLYDPGTLRERAYMQSLPIDRLHVEVDVERLDNWDGNLQHELEMDQEWDLNLFWEPIDICTIDQESID